jgi:hypothetical protein
VKIVYYAAKKDFIVYLPTNGRLMKPEIIDRLGDAGLGTVNLAVDCVDDIGIHYHIVESPMLEAQHFKHLDENSTYLTPEDYPKVDLIRVSGST